MTANSGSKINIDIDSYVVADKRLTKGIIDICMKLEALIEKGIKAVGQDIKQKVILDATESGIEVVLRTSQPIPNKPVIYELNFIINTIAFKNWVDVHKRMLHSGILAFRNADNLVMCITEEAMESFYRIDIQGSKETTLTKLMSNGLTIFAHREVVNNHAWIVKVVA